MGYFSSAIGRKQLMGLTGLVWAGFVLMHMLGNVLILAGPEMYNHYSYALVSNPLIYLAELLLLFALLIHVYDGIVLTLKNKAARPTKYAMPTNGKKAAKFQSKWMIFHGSIILVFIILHLIQFKYGTNYKITANGVEMRDLFKLVVEIFHEPVYVVAYCICMVIVGLHLSHGFASSFASLGIFHPRYSPVLSIFGYFYATVVALGFIVPPIYVLCFL